MSLTVILAIAVVILLLMVLGVLEVRVSDGRTEVTLERERVRQAAGRAVEKVRGWFRHSPNKKSRQSG